LEARKAISTIDIAYALEAFGVLTVFFSSLLLAPSFCLPALKHLLQEIKASVAEWMVMGWAIL